MTWLSVQRWWVFTMGIISRTYHSSSPSRAKFHSCDAGHLVRPQLGNVFNTTNLCWSGTMETLTKAVVHALYSPLATYFSQRSCACQSRLCSREMLELCGRRLLAARLIKEQLCSDTASPFWFWRSFQKWLDPVVGSSEMSDMWESIFNVACGIDHVDRE